MKRLGKLKNALFYKGILLDLDDTIYSYKSSHYIAIRQCFKHYSNLKIKSLPQLSFKQFNDLYTESRLEVSSNNKIKSSGRSRLLGFKKFFFRLNIEPSFLIYKYAEEFENFYWQSLIKNSVIDEQINCLFLEAKKLNIRIFIITDMQLKYQIHKLRHLKILDKIEHIISSEELGIEKPNVKIFLAALKIMGLPKKDIVVIGDSKEKDINGAKKAGLPYIHYVAK